MTEHVKTPKPPSAQNSAMFRVGRAGSRKNQPDTKPFDVEMECHVILPRQVLVICVVKGTDDRHKDATRPESVSKGVAAISGAARCQSSQAMAAVGQMAYTVIEATWHRIL